jgi:hypothetical protein
MVVLISYVLEEALDLSSDRLLMMMMMFCNVCVCFCNTYIYCVLFVYLSLLFCSFFMFCSFLVVIVVLCIFIFVCTSVGLLPPGESAIAVSNNNIFINLEVQECAHINRWNLLVKTSFETRLQ